VRHGFIADGLTDGAAACASYVPSCPARVEAVCTPQKYQHDTRKNGRDDRFIERVDTVTTTGEREAFVFKGYADDCGQRTMHVFRALATCRMCPPDSCPVSRPLAYIPEERLLISRWVHGRRRLQTASITSINRR